MCTSAAMKHRTSIAIVFLLGCATGGVAAQLVVPPVRAMPDGTPDPEIDPVPVRAWCLGWESRVTADIVLCW